MTGFGDLSTIKDSTPLGYVAQNWESNITAMVAMAQKANIKVILGNLPAMSPHKPTPGVCSSLTPGWINMGGQTTSLW